MDHLLRPQDGIDLRIECRYLCEDEVHYDHGDFRSFPSQQGYRLDSHGRVSLEELHRHRGLSEASFLQAWLFFGLLQQ